MENDFDIEIAAEENSGEAGTVQLPLNFLSFGEIEPDDVKVYIRQDVYKALEKFASSDTSKELGSILVGDYSEQMGKINVVISGYIEAKYTDASAATLTFTHETWDYIHKQHEKQYPDKKIIGWQHTHPNYGIFLSNYDLFIQNNFFNLPFQVAYVIDPVQNLRGFFQWKNEKTEKLKGYYIYDEVGKPVKIEQKKIDKAEKTKSGTGKLMTALVALLCVISLGLGAFAVNMYGKYKEQLVLQQTLSHQLEQKENTIGEQKAAIDNLQTKLVEDVLEAPSESTVNALISDIESGELVLENSDEILKELRKLVASGSEKAEDLHFVSYTVKSGDSLSSICNEHKIDYEASKGIILALNGISDPDSIFSGQTIVLPV